MKHGTASELLHTREGAPRPRASTNLRKIPPTHPARTHTRSTQNELVIGVFRYVRTQLTCTSFWCSGGLQGERCSAPSPPTPTAPGTRARTPPSPTPAMRSARRWRRSMLRPPPDQRPQPTSVIPDPTHACMHVCSTRSLGRSVCSVGRSGGRGREVRFLSKTKSLVLLTVACSRAGGAPRPRRSTSKLQARPEHRTPSWRRAAPGGRRAWSINGRYGNASAGAGTAASG